MSHGYGVRPWVVWGVGLLAYTTAAMHRSSLGVAGLEAADHFSTTAGIVSTFVVLQLATYALAQVPVGVLLDRFGSRAMIAVGALMMGAGQALLAVTDDLTLAYAARILLGIGDACSFNSVLRLLPRWFAPRLVPLLSQATGMVAGLGQVAAVAAILPLIQHRGWTTGLLIAAAVSVVPATAAAIWIRDSPTGRSVVVDRLRDLPSNLLGVTRHPATQLGFWIHFTAGFSFTAFVFMWGLPYLMVGQGLSQGTAGTLFSLVAVAAMVVGPIIGTLTARHPLRRSTLALLIISSNVVAWAIVLLWPGKAPLPLLVLLCVALSAGGPGTGIGFDFPRTSLPTSRLGAANGVVIAGSFSAATILILAMGIFLDVVAEGGQYTPDHLRWAWMLQAPLYAVGITGILISRRKLRRQMAESGIIVPSWREVVERIRRNRAR